MNVLDDLFKSEVTSAPFLSLEVFSDEPVRDDIVNYMVDRIKKHYNVQSYNEAIQLWGRYRSEVLKDE